MKALRDRINEPRYDNEFSRVLIQAEDHFFALHETHHKRWIRFMGGYLFDGQSYEYCIDIYDKQKLIYEVAKQNQSVLEIGTYVGHSLLLMLLANPRLAATCIDISDQYAKPSIDYLKAAFPGSEIEFIHKHSLAALPTIEKTYDMFHIDGTHNNEIVSMEFYQCLEKRSSDTVAVVFDDVYACQGLLKEIEEKMDVLETRTAGCAFANAYYKLKIPAQA